MSQEVEVKLGKSLSKKLTETTEFKTARGDLLIYNEDLTEHGYDNPKITLVISEDLEKHQFGIARLIIADSESRKSYLVHVDGLLSTIYAAYAKSLNDLRKPTIRQKTVRMAGYFTELFGRVRHSFQK